MHSVFPLFLIYDRTLRTLLFIKVLQIKKTVTKRKRPFLDPDDDDNAVHEVAVATKTFAALVASLNYNPPLMTGSIFRKSSQASKTRGDAPAPAEIPESYHSEEAVYDDDEEDPLFVTPTGLALAHTQELPQQRDKARLWREEIFGCDPSDEKNKKQKGDPKKNNK